MHHVKKPERVTLNVLLYEMKYFYIKNKYGVEVADKALKGYTLKRYGITGLREIGLTIMRNGISNRPRFNYKTLPYEILKRARELGISIDLKIFKI